MTNSFMIKEWRQQSLNEATCRFYQTKDFLSFDVIPVLRKTCLACKTFLLSTAVPFVSGCKVMVVHFIKLFGDILVP